MVFIDESGNARDTQHFLRAWIAAGVAIPDSKRVFLEQQLAQFRAQHFKSDEPEVRGQRIRRGTRKGVTPDILAGDLADLMKATGASVWVTASRHGVNPLPVKAADGQTGYIRYPRDIARQLLLERICGSLGPASGSHLLVWDLSTQQELNEFSRRVALFRDGFTNVTRPDSLIGALAGGLSHDWPGLQVSDFYAHFGLHYLGHRRGWTGASEAKATAFQQHLLPTLKRDGYNKLVGWKEWI